MKGVQRIVLFLVSLVMAGAAARAQATPEAALEEMVTTDKVEVVLRHFPVSVQKVLDALSPDERARALGELVISKKMEQQHVKIIRSDDDNGWRVATPEGDQAVIKLKNSFVSGLDALLVLQIQEKRKIQAKASGNDPESPEKPQETDQAGKPAREPEWEEDRSKKFMVSMRLEEGEWRLTEIGAAEQKSFESEGFVRELISKGDHPTAAGAAAYLRTLVASIITYASAYPDVGYPNTLSVLAGPPGSEPAADHAMLIDQTYLENPLIKDGYEFQYVRVDAKQFRITATPIEIGKKGTRSFFVDESGVIRSTTEPRVANENDEPL